METTINVFSAGSLERLLNDSQKTHTEILNLSGFLNGSDIATINSLKNLSILDLSNTKIVKGGSEYYYTYNDSYFTHDDEIGYSMFFQCEKLTKIILPNSVKIIGYRAFFAQPELSHITIPDSVIGIGKEAFKDCKLKTVIIGEKVQWIGDSAFKHCETLQNITIPENVIYIGNSTFSHCPNLETVTIEGDIQFIGSGIFSYCNKLSKIYCKNILPADKTTFRKLDVTNCKMYASGKEIDISNYAFQEPNKELSINLQCAGTMKHFRMRHVEKIKLSGYINGDDIVAIREMINGVHYEGKLAVLDLSDTRIVEGGKYYYKQYRTTYRGSISRTDICCFNTNNDEIGSYMFFECKKISEIVLPNNIKKIQDYAFGECGGLLHITIPNSVIEIEEFAFNNCLNLQSITIGDTVQRIKNYAFKGCIRLSCVTIPDNTIYIGCNAFENCSNLETVTLGYNVQTIGKNAFLNCDKLSKIIRKGLLPKTDSMLSTGINANKCNFILTNNDMDSSDLTEGAISVTVNVPMAGTLKDLISDSQKKKVQYLKLSGYINGDDIIIIRMMIQFFNLIYLDIFETQIVSGGNPYYNYGTLQNTKEHEIGDFMFYECKELSRIILPKNINRIGECAFYGCEKLSHITIFNNVKEIKKRAFYGCSNLEEINLGKEIKTIDNNVFCLCKKLSHIRIPDSVTTIEEDAFYGCSSLKTIELGKNIQIIKDNAFEYCKNLSHINIPESVVELGDRIFCECSSLETILWGGKIQKIGEYLFKGCKKIANITIPASINYIERGTFSGCSNLKKVNFGENIKRIASRSFEECQSLCHVIIPNSVTNIGDNAFDGDYNLEEITLGKWIKSLGTGTFRDCRKLSTIVIPDNTTEIAQDVFNGCSSLESITIGEKVKSIGDRAFKGCCKLQKISCKGLPPHIDETTFSEVDIENCELYVKACYINNYKDDEHWKRFITEEQLTNKEPTKSIFDTLFERYQNEFIYQKGRAQYDNLYDKVRNSSKLGELCRMSVQGGMAPNAEDFKIAAMIGNTWFGFNQTLTRMGALIALKIWHESINIRYHMINDITLYNKAQSIIRLIS